MKREWGSRSFVEYNSCDQEEEEELMDTTRCEVQKGDRAVQ